MIEIDGHNVPLVVCWGGGTNSTAMVIGMFDRQIVPDLIMFADTGGEKPETYKYIDLFSQYLKEIRFPDIVIVKNDGMYGTLEKNCLDQEMLPSLAYGFKSCSQKYKIRPQDKFCDRWQPAVDCWNSGRRVVKAIGYDFGPRDSRRATIKDNEKYNFIYPLILWRWDRPVCEGAIRKAGLPLPGKSACFFCPAMKKHEVLELAEKHPDLMERALAMEANAAPNMETIRGLGRNWSWSSLIKADREQIKLMPDPPPIACECFDGDSTSFPDDWDL